MNRVTAHIRPLLPAPLLLPELRVQGPGVARTRSRSRGRPGHRPEGGICLAPPTLPQHRAGRPRCPLEGKSADRSLRVNDASRSLPFQSTVTCWMPVLVTLGWRWLLLLGAGARSASASAPATLTGRPTGASASWRAGAAAKAAGVARPRAAPESPGGAEVGFRRPHVHLAPAPRHCPPAGPGSGSGARNTGGLFRGLQTGQSS